MATKNEDFAVWHDFFQLLELPRTCFRVRFAGALWVYVIGVEIGACVCKMVLKFELVCVMMISNGKIFM